MYKLNTFYQSKKWRKLVDILKIERLNADGQLICEHCGKPIVKAYDCIGHHIIELTEDNVNDVNISLNPDYVMLIHFKCHNIIHERYEGFNRKVYLVYGSPCSGKSTFVNDNARHDDLVVDIDKIWECISISNRYHKGARLKANVFGIRDCLIDQIKIRKGNWRAAYVIGGYPLASDRERMIELLGAEPIFIDEPKEVCLARCENDDWRGYVEDWFDSYTE